MNTLSTVCSSMLLFAGLCVTSLGHAGSIKIEKVDCRAIYDLQCQIDFDSGNNHYMDWHDYFGVWPGSKDIHWGVSTNSSNWSCSGGQCGGDGLYYLRENPATGQRLFIDKEDNPITYSNLVLQCWFKINDAWHYDWEGLGTWNGDGDIKLVLDGCNGGWDGSQWVGDLLRHGEPTTCHWC